MAALVKGWVSAKHTKAVWQRKEDFLRNGAEATECQHAEE